MSQKAHLRFSKCLDGEIISVKITLFGLVIENSEVSDISRNMKKVLIFTISD
jgi:hypothetical protein